MDAQNTPSRRRLERLRNVALLVVGLAGLRCGSGEPDRPDEFPKNDGAARPDAGGDARPDVPAEPRDAIVGPADVNVSEATPTTPDGGSSPADANADPAADRRHDAIDATQDQLVDARGGNDDAREDTTTSDALEDVDATTSDVGDATIAIDQRGADTAADAPMDLSHQDSSAPTDVNGGSDVCVPTTTTCPPTYECGSIVDECGKTISCGPACSGAQEQCVGGHCVCIPKDCSAMPGACGALDDGCSGTVQCSCAAGEACVEKACAGDHLTWVRRAGGAGATVAPMAAAAQGDSIVVAGHFSGVFDVGSYRLTSVGGDDVFIAKYDRQGNVLWARSAGGTGDDYGRAITASSSGIVVVGSFVGAATFGATILQSSGQDDAFVAKYDGAGNLVWIRSFGGTSADYADSAGLGPDDSILVAGNYRGTAAFDATHTLTSVGEADFLVAKYDAAGNVLWVLSEGGPAADYVRGLAVGSDGRFALTGLFTGTCTFGEGANIQTLTVDQSNDIFVGAYQPSGELAWVRQVRSTVSNSPSVVAMDAQGNVYAGGGVAGVVEFAAGIGFTTSTTNPDAFLAKYDATGSVGWARRGEGDAYDQTSDVAISPDGTILWTGYFLQTIAMGTSTVLANRGAFDVFIARQDPSGNLLWATRQGTTDIQVSTGIVAFADGAWAIVGYFSGHLGFGTGTPTPALGNYDMYVARFAP